MNDLDEIDNYEDAVERLREIVTSYGKKHPDEILEWFTNMVIEDFDMLSETDAVMRNEDYGGLVNRIILKYWLVDDDDQAEDEEDL